MASSSFQPRLHHTKSIQYYKNAFNSPPPVSAPCKKPKKRKASTSSNPSLKFFTKTECPIYVHKFKKLHLSSNDFSRVEVKPQRVVMEDFTKKSFAPTIQKISESNVKNSMGEKCGKSQGDNLGDADIESSKLIIVESSSVEIIQHFVGDNFSSSIETNPKLNQGGKESMNKNEVKSCAGDSLDEESVESIREQIELHHADSIVLLKKKKMQNKGKFKQPSCIKLFRKNLKNKGMRTTGGSELKSILKKGSYQIDPSLYYNRTLKKVKSKKLR